MQYQDDIIRCLKKREEMEEKRLSQQLDVSVTDFRKFDAETDKMISIWLVNFTKTNDEIVEICMTDYTFAKFRRTLSKIKRVVLEGASEKALIKLRAKKAKQSAAEEICLD